MEIFYAAKKRAEDAGDAKALEWFNHVEEKEGGYSYYFYIVDGKNESDGTALHLAAWDDAPEAARRLLEVNADVNAVGGGRCYETPLHVSVGPELIKVLCEAKADLWASDARGDAPFDLAKKRHGARGLAPFARGAPSRAILAALVACEGPETIEALEDWKKEAKIPGKPMERAHLRERLRVILAEGREYGDWRLYAEEDYANLKDQNIIAKPEVQASLWYLPGLSAADACDADLLHALVKTTNEEVFQTDTVQAVVQAAWAQMRFSTAWEVISCLLTVGLLCVASYTFRHGLPDATATRRYMTSRFASFQFRVCKGQVHAFFRGQPFLYYSVCLLAALDSVR